MSPHVWIKESRPDVLKAGEAREAQEEKCNQAADRVEAPPCPGCGKGVKDSDFDQHRAEVHNRPRQVFRPYGKPSSRELLISAPDVGKLEQKLQEWQTRNPGVRLIPLGEGKNEDTGLLWVRARIAPIFKERWAS